MFYYLLGFKQEVKEEILRNESAKSEFINQNPDLKDIVDSKEFENTVTELFEKMDDTCKKNANLSLSNIKGNFNQFFNNSKLFSEAL